MILRRIVLTSFIIMAIVIALADGSSLADKTGVNPEVYGTWDMLELNTYGMTVQLTLAIEENQVIATSSCFFQDYSVSAQAVSPAEITAHEIRVLESNEAVNEYSSGFLVCRASLDVGDLQYQLRDGKLVITDPEKEETFELSRSGDQFQPAKQYKGQYKKSTDPKLALAHTSRGTAYLKKGQYNEAIREYNKALEINPNGTVAYYNRSIAYTRTGQYDKAVSDCNKALELDPEHANSYYNRGVSYYKLGSKDQAIKDFQAAANLQHKGAQDFLRSNGIAW